MEIISCNRCAFYLFETTHVILIVNSNLQNVWSLPIYWPPSLACGIFTNVTIRYKDSTMFRFAFS